jgi:hypothetical protein
MACAAQAQVQTPAPAPGVQEGGSAGKFAALQRNQLARIAQRLQVLQTLQACVQGAADVAALKTCNASAKAAAQH